MTEKNYLLFDLDGTLTDPKEGITKSLQYALRFFGVDVADADTLTPFIGPPLREMLSKTYGFVGEEAERVVAKYRERYIPTGIYENRVYDGIEDLLKNLQQAGKKIILATSKPIESAELILKHFGCYKYITFVAGSDWEGKREKKADVIRYAFENVGITDAREAVMIGDREHDIFGAKEVGLDSIGVLYGYGNLRELQAAGATQIAESVSALAALLL